MDSFIVLRVVGIDPVFNVSEDFRIFSLSDLGGVAVLDILLLDFVQMSHLDVRWSWEVEFLDLTATTTDAFGVLFILGAVNALLDIGSLGLLLFRSSDCCFNDSSTCDGVHLYLGLSVASLRISVVEEV